MLVRGMTGYLPADLIRNHLRNYEFKQERNIIILEKENRYHHPFLPLPPFVIVAQFYVASRSISLIEC